MYPDSSYYYQGYLGLKPDRYTIEMRWKWNHIIRDQKKKLSIKRDLHFFLFYFFFLRDTTCPALRKYAYVRHKKYHLKKIRSWKSFVKIRHTMAPDFKKLKSNYQSKGHLSICNFFILWNTFVPWYQRFIFYYCFPLDPVEWRTSSIRESYS